MNMGAFTRARSRSRSNWMIVLTPALATGFLLTACGGGTSAGDPTGTGVASLPPTATEGAGSGGNGSGGSKAKAPSKAADDGRPVIRVDTSDAEVDRLFAVYVKCLHSHGMKSDPTKLASAFGIDGNAKDSPEAFKACQSKEPVSPAALDPARNPHYADDKRDWINCINKNSPIIKVVANKDGWTYAKSSNGTEADHDAFNVIEHNCMLKAFGRE